MLATSTLYRGIERLQQRGLIEESSKRLAEPSGGPPRKYYSLTERGRFVAEQEAERLRDVMAFAEVRLMKPRQAR